MRMAPGYLVPSQPPLICASSDKHAVLHMLIPEIELTRPILVCELDYDTNYCIAGRNLCLAFTQVPDSW